MMRISGCDMLERVELEDIENLRGFWELGRLKNSGGWSKRRGSLGWRDIWRVYWADRDVLASESLRVLKIRRGDFRILRIWGIIIKVRRLVDEGIIGRDFGTIDTILIQEVKLEWFQIFIHLQFWKIMLEEVTKEWKFQRNFLQYPSFLKDHLISLGHCIHHRQFYRQIYSSFSEVHTCSNRVALVYSRWREIVARYRACDRDRELEISRTEISCSRSPRRMYTRRILVRRMLHDLSNRCR